MKKLIINYGLLSAAATAILSILYLNDVLGTWTLTGVSLALAIGFLVLGARAFKTGNNGYATFKEIFMVCVGISLVALVVSTVIGQVYNATLSEEKKNEIIAKQVDVQRDVAESFGQELTDEMEETFEKEAAETFELKTALLGIPIGLIFFAAVSAIIGLIMKKEPPIQVV